VVHAVTQWTARSNNRKESSMKTADIKRNAFRSVLVLHFIGLAMSLGTRLADFAIDRLTSGGSLQVLSFGRDLTSRLAFSLVLPGFLLMIASGITMVLLRYGLHPPLWVWIKAGVSTLALFVATPLAAPALAAARQWAQWSAEHNQLAPQFSESAAKASFYGGIVFVLFLLNIPIAIWKPFASIRLPRIRDLRRAEAKTLVQSDGVSR
jgi:hypothetical protein